MDELTFIDKIKRIIKMRHDVIVSAMASGSFEDSLISFFLVGFTPTNSLFGNSIFGF